MAERTRPWPDVPRLLRKRRELGDLHDHSVATSATAFLAWKAFLIVARAEIGREQEQCAKTVSGVLDEYPALWAEVGRFVGALAVLQKATPAVVAEWYCDPALDGPTARRRIQWALRSIQQVQASIADGRPGSNEARTVAEHMYAIRSSVLAHASVQSMDYRFQRIVPRFEALTCKITCGAYAQRAGIGLEAAMRELEFE